MTDPTIHEQRRRLVAARLHGERRARLMAYALIVAALAVMLAPIWIALMEAGR